MHRILCSAAVIAMVAVSSAAQPSRALMDISDIVMEYKADVETRGKNIDDAFNASAADGWRPIVRLDDGGRHRLLFGRVKDGSGEPMEYKAEVLYFAENIDDRFDELSEGGWRPIFVFHTGLRYRMLFERETDPDLRVEMEYRADTIDDTREVDDKFNQYAGDGWRAMFLLSATDSTEIRMLFGRPSGDDTPRYRYAAEKEWLTRHIDDVFNERASDGWRPAFVFPDKDQYRMLFERPRSDDDIVRYEYRADLVAEAREIDDKFNRYAADGWSPVEVFWDESKLEYRLLFARHVRSSAAGSR